MKTNESVNKAKATVDIICPTWNNPQILAQMIKTVFNYTAEPFRFILVNNGDQSTLPAFGPDSRLVVLQAPKNLGWMGGVNAGLKWAAANDPAKFAMWINDDVQVMPHDYGWLPKMLACFDKPGVGLVGPVSNAVMGYQSINFVGLPPSQESTRISGLCCLTNWEVLNKVGLLDESLPGGDDLDFSIRVRQAGYKLCICRRSFLLHNYATTGRRVHGDYWDSREHSEAINKAIIQKHGFKTWFTTVNDLFPPADTDFVAHEEKLAIEELESIAKDGKKVLDLGCGGRKIAAWATGVDIRHNGEFGVGYNSQIASAADVQCDATKLDKFEDGSVGGILAKHLLEHIVDPFPVLKEWGRVLDEGGRLVIIVPDYRYCEAMSCDPSHVHAYTPESLKSLLEAVGGFKVTRTEQINPGHVFMVSAEKVPARVAVLV